MIALPLDPALAVGLGGVVGVVGGVVFFQGVRRFAQRAVAAGRDRAWLVAGLAGRLAAVAVLVGGVAYAGGSPGALAVLVGLVLARFVIRRSTA